MARGVRLCPAGTLADRPPPLDPRCSGAADARNCVFFGAIYGLRRTLGATASPAQVRSLMAVTSAASCNPLIPSVHIAILSSASPRRLPLDPLAHAKR